MSCIALIEVSKGENGQYLGRVVVPEGKQADAVRTTGAEDPIPQAMDDQGMALYEARDFEKPEVQEGAGKRQKDDEANSDILESKFLPDRAENNESVEQDIERLRKAIVRNFKETTGRTIRSNPGDITRVSLRNHQALQRIADQFGAKVIGIRVNSKVLDTFQGVTLRDGVIYINEKARRPHLAILGHELGHQLRRDNPQLWQQLVDEIRPFIKKEYYGRNFPDVMGTTDPDALREEFVSEVLSDGFMSTRFWNELGKSNPSLLSRIVDLLTDLINQIRVSVGYTPKTKAYLTDYDRVLRIAGRYVGKYAPPGLGSKPDGQPKFLPNETPPSEGFSDSDTPERDTDLWAEVDRAAPKEGWERKKELLDWPGMCVRS